MRRKDSNGDGVQCFGGPHDGYVVELGPESYLLPVLSTDRYGAVRTTDHLYVRSLDPWGNEAYVHEGITIV